jgi:hypothetical protein
LAANCVTAENKLFSAARKPAAENKLFSAGFFGGQTPPKISPLPPKIAYFRRQRAYFRRRLAAENACSSCSESICHYICFSWVILYFQIIIFD